MQSKTFFPVLKYTKALRNVYVLYPWLYIVFINAYVQCFFIMQQFIVEGGQ